MSELAQADGLYQEAYYNVLVARVDQSRAAAETVQRAAAAIGALYGSVVGVVFSVTDNRLPLRGVLPLVFLGLAIVLSTSYLAWGGGGNEPETTDPGGTQDAVERAKRYLYYFAAIVGEFIARRRHYLRGAILALMFGLVLLPAPFVEVDPGDAPDDSAHVEMPRWPSPERVETRAELKRYRFKLNEIAGRRADVRLQRAEAEEASPLRLSFLPDNGAAWILLPLLMTAVLAGCMAMWAVGERAVDTADDKNPGPPGGLGPAIPEPTISGTTNPPT